MNTGESSSERAATLPPLALIAGPTASGKSDLAIRLALRLAEQGKRAVIVNADSAQVYADLQILSARPSPEEMQGIEHRLFGTWDGAESCSAADWADAARREIAAIHSDGALPILVGGTGLYIRTLLEGIAPVPAIDPAIREQVRALPVDQAYAQLKDRDPVRAGQLNPADSLRIARSLEVVLSTGRTLIDWQGTKTGGIGAMVALTPAILLPDRDWLYQRCDRRFSQMLEGGGIAEARALQMRNLAPDLPVMRAIGLREAFDYLDGKCSLDETIRAGAQATRNYVKRQLTWLRHQPPTDWPRFALETFSEADIFAPLLRN